MAEARDSCLRNMESDISQAFEAELTCLICLDSLTDPVTISCGHSFCRACLCLSWEDKELPVPCPTCRHPSQHKDLRTNILLKRLVSIARQHSLMKYPSCEEHRCVTHKETKRIFCEENWIPLCQLCSDSQEHMGHRHCPIEAAAEGQMERLLKQMAYLWEKTQENQENLEEEKRMKSQWMDYVTLWKEMIRTEYRKLHPRLYEEERQHLECVNLEGQTFIEELRKSEAIMVQNRNQLIKVYQELMRMSQQPYVLLLQDLEDMFKRSESVQLCLPHAMEPELRALPITGLTERSNCFRVNIAFENVTRFTYNRDRLLRNMRRFCSTSQHQGITVESTGHTFAAWGSQSFTSGKYYWEIELRDSWDWVVGVCQDDWLMDTRRENYSLSAFLLVCMKFDNHYSLFSTSPERNHCVEKPVGQVGVLLDCEGGYISFLNVAKSSLIYSYPPGTFHNPIRPFFCTSHTGSREAVIHYVSVS